DYYCCSSRTRNTFIF
nr:immunoglobulin light chain junction region [Macaca mulatta]